jgi:hypothetical protein
MATKKKPGMLEKMMEFVAGILPSEEERKPHSGTMAAKTVTGPPKKVAKKVGAAAKKAPLKNAAKKSGVSMDRKLIALSQPHEVRDWSKTLGCTEAELNGAVAAVGRSAAKVREHLSKTRGRSMDRKLIALSQPHEVRDWCKSLGCSEDELLRAVGAVGRSAVKVREYLKK